MVFFRVLLIKYNKPPGGFRCLARLKVINTDAYLDILKIQGSIDIDRHEIDKFINLYECGNQNYFIEKILWMKENGFKDESFHMLWILLGLQVKKGKDLKKIQQKSKSWLNELNWDSKVLNNKLAEIQNIFYKYGIYSDCPETRLHHTNAT